MGDAEKTELIVCDRKRTTSVDEGSRDGRSRAA
jgi:hypothetical protein